LLESLKLASLFVNGVRHNEPDLDPHVLSGSRTSKSANHVHRKNQSQSVQEWFVPRSLL
ncbi:MAG: hypothetical protein Q9184_005612, partial [Pyrenodesmia sp. 2 TL-2023]